ncbi:hypothetical protein VM1G_02963 [Cytospora mali]|uniref:C2H2-type domain-containing protein n=1 Tax=Cytospora mali TaxID=578113 RepID=A0A194VUD0_CYTMA|nr:hypothetical protein VM1G_02963 [Valsa mali]
MEMSLSSAKASNKRGSKPAQAVRRGEAETTLEGLEAISLPTPPYHIEKASDSCIDSPSDTATSPALSRASTFASSSSISTITSLGSPVTRCFQLDDSTTLDIGFRSIVKCRATTWPQLPNHILNIPLTLSDIPPMAKSHQAFGQDTDTSSGNANRRHSYHHGDRASDQNSTPPEERSLDLFILGHAQSTKGIPPARRSCEPQSPASLPSEVTTVARSDPPKDPFFFSSATEPREQSFPGHTAGTILPSYKSEALANKPDGHYRACPWLENRNNFRNSHDALMTESLGLSKPSLTQEPSLPRRPGRQGDHREGTKSRAKDDIKTVIQSISCIDDYPRDEEPDGDSHLSSGSCAIFDSNASVDSLNPSSPEGAVERDIETNRVGNDTHEYNQENEEIRSPSNPRTPDGDSSFSGEKHKECDKNYEYEYQKLVEGISNLILESYCFGDLEDREIPLELYIHGCLEQVSNHQSANLQCHASRIPVRTPPLQICNPGKNTGSSRMSMGAGHRGNSGNKRKNGGNGNTGRGGRDTGDNHDADDDDDDDDEADDDQGDPVRTKKRKTGKCEDLSCPFRRRNPVRFNVREYRQCAFTSFQNLALLKRHLQRYHALNEPVRCPRCNMACESEEEKTEHLAADPRCPQLNDHDEIVDPEDGITRKALSTLTERKYEDKVSSWKGIWELIFPSDQNIPVSEHYEPPVEIDEVEKKLCDRRNFMLFIDNKRPTGDNEAPTIEQVPQYVLEVLNQCHDGQAHERSLKRDESFKEFLNMVGEGPPPTQSQPVAQQADLMQDFAYASNPQNPGTHIAGSTGLQADHSHNSTSATGLQYSGTHIFGSTDLQAGLGLDSSYYDTGMSSTAVDPSMQVFGHNPRNACRYPPSLPYINNGHISSSTCLVNDHPVIAAESSCGGKDSGLGTSLGEQGGRTNEAKDHYNNDHTPNHAPNHTFMLRSQASEVGHANGGRDIPLWTCEEDDLLFSDQDFSQLFSAQ